MDEPKDRNGRVVRLGSRVRVLSLSGQWFEDLPEDERGDVLSMVGEVFEVTEIDKYGYPWIGKTWPEDDEEGAFRGHSIALESHEVELVDDVP